MGGNINKVTMSALDNFFVTIEFFGVALFLLLALVFWNALTSDVVDEGIWEKTDVGLTARDQGQAVYNNLDNIGFIVYFALHLGILVMAFFLRSHPIMYVGVILLTAVLMLIAAPLSNTYEDVKTSSPDLIIANADLPKVGFIMERLPLWEMIWAFVSGIVLTGLAKGEDFL